MEKKRVCINGMTENDQIRGPVRYIYELIAHIPDDLFDIILIAGTWQKNIYCNLEGKVSVIYFDINKTKVVRALFFMFYMPLVLKKLKIDLYHIPDTNPLPIFRFGAKIISTIHDCAEYVVPWRFSPLQSKYRRFVSKLQAKYSDIVITVSNSSRKDIVKYLNVSSAKVHVIYNGISNLKCEMENHEKASNTDKYILYVGVLERAKNVDKLLMAFAEISEDVKRNTKLYLIGRKGNDYENIINIINENGLQKYVYIPGYISDSELCGLYRNALVFAYLSEYEGFGLPVLEAMQYGVPVLTTNKSSLGEVAGDAAIKTETSLHEIKNNLTMLLTDEGKRREYVRRGYVRCKDFTWDKSAEETISTYEKVLNY